MRPFLKRKPEHHLQWALEKDSLVSGMLRLVSNLRDLIISFVSIEDWSSRDYADGNGDSMVSTGR